VSPLARRPILRKSHSGGQKPVNEDWIRLAPMKTVIVS
jgi:hypothetical protein